MFICHSWIISSSSALVPGNRLNGRTTDVSFQHYHSSGSADAHDSPRIAWMSEEDIQDEDGDENEDISYHPYINYF